MDLPTIEYTFPAAKNVAVIGDIHGSFKDMVNKCCVQYELTDTLIIVAGDCGFGFQRPAYYEDLYMQQSGRLAKSNNWIVFIRGNHDNPAYFDGKTVNYKRWKAIPDYSILKACGHTILCVGGATSVDRTYRINKFYGSTVIVENDKRLNVNAYWRNERPVYDQAKLNAINERHAVDTVISHTAPSFCEKMSRADIQDWLIKDEELLDDIKQERKVMDNIYAYLYSTSHPLSQWFYGHFHQSWHSEIDGVKYNLLDCMELREL